MKKAKTRGEAVQASLRSLGMNCSAKDAQEFVIASYPEWAEWAKSQSGHLFSVMFYCTRSKLKRSEGLKSKTTLGSIHQPTATPQTASSDVGISVPEAMLLQELKEKLRAVLKPYFTLLGHDSTCELVHVLVAEATSEDAKK